MEPDTIRIDTGLSTNTGPVLETGAVIQSRYLVRELLGRGGMGSVYLVEDAETGKKLALKCLSKQNTNDGTWRRFDNEAKAIQKLEHTNLIKLHESGLLPDGQPYFIMDLVQGETLAEVLKKRGRLEVRQAIKIFVQVGFALGYAHSKGIIHRDIKPSNIMIERCPENSTLDGTIKLLDFGIAKITGHDEFNQQTLTRTGEVFGSPLYMSPEQCLGVAVDFRCDLYSLGCVFYESLTGAPPHVGENALATMMKHQAEKPLSLKEASLGVEFPAELERIAAKLLEKRAQDRYETAQSLCEDLVRLEEHLSDKSLEKEHHPIISVTSHRSGKFDWHAPLPITSALLLFLAGFASGFFCGRGQISNQSEQNPNKLPTNAPAFEVPKSQSEQTPAERQKSVFDQLEADTKAKKFSTLSEDGKTIVFRFPKFSIGTITAFTGRHVFTGGAVSYEAKGEVKVPLHSDKSFIPCFELKNHPALFSRFDAQDLNLIDFTGQNQLEKNIDAGTANIDDILPHITHLKGLEAIWFDNTSLSDKNLHYLNKLPNLDSLGMNNTRVTAAKLSQMKFLRQLKMLKIKGMQNIEPLINKLHEMRAFKTLTLQRCNLSNDDIRKIGHLKLTDLRLCDNEKIDNQCVEYLPDSLKLLDLTGCSVTAEASAKLARLKKLDVLFLDSVRWSEKDAKKLESLLNGKVIRKSNNLLRKFE